MTIRTSIFSLALLAGCVAAQHASVNLPSLQVLDHSAISPDLIPNFHKVNDHIYRSGRPTQEGIKDLGKIGIKTVLSLQDFGWDPNDVVQERSWVSAANMKFIHVPMHGIKKPTVDQIRLALSYLNDAVNYPILVHCEKGSDRTGIVIASYHIKSDGWDVEKAKEDMYTYGHSRWLSWWDAVLDSVYLWKDIKD